MAEKIYRSNFYLLPTVHLFPDKSGLLANNSYQEAAKQKAFVEFMRDKKNSDLWDRIREPLNNWLDYLAKLFTYKSLRNKRKNKEILSPDEEEVINYFELPGNDEYDPADMIWAQLRPLLQELDERMIAAGIDTTTFVF